ncbi:ribosomal biogenesis factor-like [Lytechinus variegatus]|uniref:ribosomal biogenesis factor-like n=1 Tax=Lytechinus variegatus TaxID=7654 RepID=UPI001BB2AA55|nr:ribosomal biogenesis factor-like [Lytechinus variegatus]XP_041453851.1 ribosomal biogenesis factor-like [Lytechinus variegatus]
MGKQNKQKQKSSLVKPKRQHQSGSTKQGSSGAQGQKASAFRVSSHKALKAKHKTKQVTSNLKWMKNKSSKEQVNKNDASFSNVHQSFTVSSSKQAQIPASKPVKKLPESRQVDMDAAVLQMASL